MLNATEITIRAGFIIFSLIGLFACLQMGQPRFYCSFIKKMKKMELPKAIAICKDGSCINLMQTRWANIFGIPNWWFGMAFYGLTLLSAVWATMWVVTFAILGAIMAVAFSIVLIYGLLYRLRAYCSWCYLSHLVNFMILMLWCGAAVVLVQ